ncbi:isoleucine--tRNA ligase [Ulvibacterium sp.]|uniref:isoleucine--tRNA ligase n=1 Tax=Ulvibacterium sp. TaxID=2665914 RepID=UPI003BAB0C03
MKFAEYKGLDLPQTAKEVLDHWKEQDIFEKSVSSREGKPSYVFYEGPPSANGMPGIHHVMARTIKDIFPRYQTMKGFQVKRKAGWDTHGLPVELGVEKELGITKEDIGKKISVEDYNAACKKAVLRYTDVWNEMTEKIGYWVDMDNPYITYKSKYMESVWWLLKQIYDKGLIYKGYTIQPYSPKAGTGLSSHELNQPGTYQDITDTTVVAQFKAKKETLPDSLKDIEEDIYLLAWTTTPWTLPSNMALTVGSKIDYVLVKTFNQYTFEPIHVVLAKGLVGKQFGGKFFETESKGDFANFTKADKKIPYMILAETKGKNLIGISYEQLLDYALPYQNPENAFRVIAGDFVTTEDGTGIVHTAPTFGADDMQVAQKAEPPVPPMLVLDKNGNPVPLVDLQGRFRPEMEELAGKYVKNEYYEEGTAPERSVDVEIAIRLKEENKAFKVEKYVHSYPNCWRTDKPILYYPLDSWFIKVTEVKDRMYELNQQINWKPKATGEGRFGNWLANANDWNLSRSRYWGIPLPIWRTEEGSEEIIIGSVEQLKQEMNKSVKAGLMEKDVFDDFVIGDMSEENYEKIDLHKNIVDQIVLVSPSGKAMKRESDLIDVWFDSGSMPYAQWHYPFEKAPSNSPTGGESKPVYHTARKSSYKLFKVLAKERKKHTTEAERMLWEALRAKRLDGFKFRRQHIIDEFIVDFVCLSKKLVIEVDGAYHLKPEIKEADTLRTKILEQDFGFHVMRFTNEEVIGDMDSVLQKISEKLLGIPLVGEPKGAIPFPADFIAEGVDQTRGWFYTLHAIATMVFDSVAYKNVVSNGLVLDKDGKKMSKRYGNAVDPFETMEEHGPDATRWYMISNANPWDNLKFDIEGILEVKRKFFGTLYNTYSFFALYANIDQFDYSEKEIPLQERPEIDRWILSELNSLIKLVDEAYAAYEPTRATRAISEYVQENLSNWYVRLCRRRFWKGDYQKDKISAYQTLYTCLETIAKLSAPVAPFFMDRLYRDLTRATHKEAFESVHLANFPQYDASMIDEVLQSKMKKAQDISSLVLSIRQKERIKVRQPLQKIMIPVLDEKQKQEIEAVSDLIRSEVNVKEIELLDDASGILVKQIKPNFKILGPRFGKDMKSIARSIGNLGQEDIQKIEREGEISLDIENKIIKLQLDDVEISSQDIEGWLVASSGSLTVALDVTIDDELKKEGIARELVNRIQNLRKESGFEVTDKIDIKILKDGLVEKAVESNLKYIKTETLTAELDFEEILEKGTEVTFDEINTKLLIEKH